MVNACGWTENDVSFSFSVLLVQREAVLKQYYYSSSQYNIRWRSFYKLKATRMSKKKATTINLPMSRTAKIMTSAVGVESVNQDIVALATKATEYFIMDFARRAYDQAAKGEFRSNTLEYNDIQELVHSDPRYNFLIDTTPKKIKFSEALKLVEEANNKRKTEEPSRDQSMDL